MSNPQQNSQTWTEAPGVVESVGGDSNTPQQKIFAKVKAVKVALNSTYTGVIEIT
jgi:hypothetical protein